jgi:hypothetical protein
MRCLGSELESADRSAENYRGNEIVPRLSFPVIEKEDLGNRNRVRSRESLSRPEQVTDNRYTSKPPVPQHVVAGT